ncbi:MAG TPA: hypothetical protein VFU47_10095, partial [Armatimonadota bacterium]|nr:hypothetical protein [Armatimonadota bacterium]
TAVEPLTVQAAKRQLQFQTDGDLLVVEHREIRPEALKKGQTVTVETESAPGADATVQALTIAVSPEPHLSAKQQRKLIQRERRR